MVQPAAKLPLRPESLNVHTQENSILLGDDLCHPEKNPAEGRWPSATSQKEQSTRPNKRPLVVFEMGVCPITLASPAVSRIMR